MGVILPAARQVIGRKGRLSRRLYPVNGSHPGPPKRANRG
jgi:hypothetical protein